MKYQQQIFDEMVEQLEALIPGVRVADAPVLREVLETAAKVVADQWIDLEVAQLSPDFERIMASPYPPFEKD